MKLEILKTHHSDSVPMSYHPTFSAAVLSFPSSVCHSCKHKKKVTTYSGLREKDDVLHFTLFSFLDFVSDQIDFLDWEYADYAPAPFDLACFLGNIFRMNIGTVAQDFSSSSIYYFAHVSLFVSSHT